MLYCLFTPPQPCTHPHPKASLEPLKVRPTEAEGQELTFSLHSNERARPPSFLPITLLYTLKLLLLLLSHFSRVRLCGPHRRQPTRLPRPWDSLGKNSGVGCQFLLQCMKVKSESEVTQSCPTLSNPMDCSLPGSSLHGIFQARVLE